MATDEQKLRTRYTSWIKRKLRSKVSEYYMPRHCEKCGWYDSQKHEGLWCSRCPGKMVDMPELCWAQSIVYAVRRGGWGTLNSFTWSVIKCETKNI